MSHGHFRLLLVRTRCAGMCGLVIFAMVWPPLLLSQRSIGTTAATRSFGYSRGSSLVCRCFEPRMPHSASLHLHGVDSGLSMFGRMVEASKTCIFRCSRMACGKNRLWDGRAQCSCSPRARPARVFGGAWMSSDASSLPKGAGFDRSWLPSSLSMGTQHSRGWSHSTKAWPRASASHKPQKTRA